MEPEELRPLLKKHMPIYADMDHTFLRSFKHRVQVWLIHTDESQRSITMEFAQDLAKKSRSSASDELIIGDSQLARQNLTKLLRNVMQEGSSTWDALAFLEELRSNNPGFDFRLSREDNGRPDGLCWMTSEMRRDLLRFGDLLHLDAQKRQYNKHGWAYRYIGPCTKHKTRIRLR